MWFRNLAQAWIPTPNEIVIISRILQGFCLQRIQAELRAHNKLPTELISSSIQRKLPETKPLGSTSHQRIGSIQAFRAELQSKDHHNIYGLLTRITIHTRNSGSRRIKLTVTLIDISSQ
jgi:hypothetical protein